MLLHLYIYIYINLRRSRDSRPAGVGLFRRPVFVSVFVSSRCFIYLFWGSVTLSTSTHHHYNESVHRKKQHTCGNNTIPYKLARLVTFESLKWKYSFATNVLIVYEIRLIAIREVSPPFGEERASTAVEEISFPANKQRRQLWTSESL